MKKRFLNIGLLLTMSLAVVNFTSCNNDEPDRPSETGFIIKGENVIGNTSGVASAKIVWWDFDEQTNEQTFDVIAEAPFVNNGFTLRVPTSLTDDFLLSVNLLLSREATVSDRNAMIAIVYGINAFNSSRSHIGDFLLMNIDNDDKSYATVWFYTDRDISIEGKNNADVEFNLSLKKGWNISYFARNNVDETVLWTTQRPAGVELKWYFDDEFTTNSTEAPLRSINSLFAR